MNLSRPILFLFAIILFATCETYDSAIIYHKGFQPGTHSLLRFDGFYSDSALAASNEFNVPSEQVKPVFFYSNGSAFATNNFTWLTGMQAAKLAGSWGNYQIEADTILLERFQKIENNYVRIILRGTISKDQIHWTARKYHREKFKPVNYSIYFRPFTTKPDSTQNFTRTLEIYNRK